MDEMIHQIAFVLFTKEALIKYKADSKGRERGESDKHFYCIFFVRVLLDLLNPGMVHVHFV